MDLDKIVLLNPNDAVTRRDAAMLQTCLDKGWSPITTPDRPAHPSDRAVLLRLVAQGWTEGWKCLRTRFPELLRDNMVLTHAVQQLQPGILQDLLDQGLNFRRTQASGKSLHMLAIEAIGRHAKSPWGEVRPGVMPLFERSLLAYAVLIKGGLDPYAVYPGEFVLGNFSPAGHTMWTRAMYGAYWHIGEALMPPDWATLTAQPRWTDAINRLDAMAHEAHPADRRTATPLWKSFLARFAEPWLAREDARILDQVHDYPVVLALPDAIRPFIWRTWNRPQEAKWTGYHSLALEAASPEAAQVLRQILIDQQGAAPGWAIETDDGLTPGQLWAMVLGAEMPVPALTPEEAIAATLARSPGPTAPR
jgi:hypothetical protein